MKIAHFTSSLQEPLGGAEQYCLRLVEHQASRGHDCTVITSWASPGVAERLAARGIPLRVVPVWRPFPPGERRRGLARILFHLLDLFSSQRPPRRLAKAFSDFDVLHVHRFQGVGTGVLAARDTTVVHTVHDFCLVDTDATSTGAEDRRFPATLLRHARVHASNRVLRRGAMIIFPSARTAQRNYALGLTAVPERMTVIPHGWNTSAHATDPATRSTSQDDHEIVTFLYLGKLTSAKGVQLLLDAWHRGIPGARLRIAGAGALEDACARAALADPSIEFLGWLDDSRRTSTLDRSDVLVVPSLWPENFPLVVAEALLHGMPVVTTKTASPPLVVHGETGLVAASDDEESLHAELAQIATQPEVLKELTDGARKVASTLDMDTHLQRLFEVYGSSSPDGPT